jgi:YtkA-like
VTVAALMLGASPAFAHDELGVMVGEYVAESPDAPDGTYRVRLTFANDGHPAEGATVTLTAADGAGATIPPTPMSPVDAGEYEAALAFPNPGAWTVTVVATAPAATFTQPLTITEPEPSSTTSNTQVQTAPIGDAGDDDDGGGGLGAGLWIGVGATLVGAAIAGMVIYRRRMA